MSDVMTVEQAAEYLQCNPETLRRAAQKGQIPAARIGRRWRFRKSALDRWLGESPTDEEEAQEEALPGLAEADFRRAARRARITAWREAEAQRRTEETARGGEGSDG